MSKGQIAPSATLADVMSTLSKPEDYLCQVLKTLHEMKKKHGNITVRIGVTGQGKSPHYRVDDLASGQPIQAFDFLGEPFPDYRAIDTQDWSTESTTFQGVRELLGSLRSAKSKRN